MVFLNQILFKYYENLGICYILYYLDIHQKELKSIQPVLLNPGAPLLFVARSRAAAYLKWKFFGYFLSIPSQIASANAHKPRHHWRIYIKYSKIKTTWYYYSYPNMFYFYTNIAVTIQLSSASYLIYADRCVANVQGNWKVRRSLQRSLAPYPNLIQIESSSNVLSSASYFVSLYGVLFLGVYGIVGIESRWRLDREREMISEATSEPYCSASCLRERVVRQ